MALFNVPAATGAGIAQLDSSVFHDVYEVYVEVTTPGPMTKFTGTPGYRRAYQVGWVGLGVTAGGGYPQSIQAGQYVEYEFGDIFPPVPGEVLPTQSVLWDLDPGVTVDIEVYYR